MLSAGNDIVSLSEINVARTKTKPLYSKILSEAEIALYEQVKENTLFEHYVWLAWSVKESAFKFLQRSAPDLLFTPVKFEIAQLKIPENYSMVSFDGDKEPGLITGDVEFANHQLYFRSVIYNELISTVVDSDKGFRGVYSSIKYMESKAKSAQSAEVRAFLISHLEKKTGYTELTIKKNSHDTPILHNGSNELLIPVSLSHHGHFVGYSFKLE